MSLAGQPTSSSAREKIIPAIGLDHGRSFPVLALVDLNHKLVDGRPVRRETPDAHITVSVRRADDPENASVSKSLSIILSSVVPG